LIEQPNIRLKRTKFLREYDKHETMPLPLKHVFIDETWIFSKGSHRKRWQDGTLATSSKKCGEEYRYIVVHAGSPEGFVQNAALVFKSHAKKGDEQNNMNKQNFEKWFKAQLFSNLKSPSLIFTDNAS
jgi:hypothetical protein